MHRKDFIKILSAATAMTTLGSFKSFTDSLQEQDEKLPLLFV
jgi:hypothetical protein